MNQFQAATQATLNHSHVHAFTNQRIAFVQACWHKDIVDQGRISFTDELVTRGLDKNQIEFFEVPGSLEIPLQARFLAQTGDFSIIVAAGLITNGGIYRHEFVSQTVISALMQVQLETHIPILSMVLTPLHFHEREEHNNFFHQHMKVKGVEAAVACVKTLENFKHC